MKRRTKPLHRTAKAAGKGNTVGRRDTIGGRAMILPDNDPEHAEACTFFYVFVDGSRSPNRSGPPDEAESKSSKSEPNGFLDWTVTIAFERFAREFSAEAQVEINPTQYHSIRKAFGIQQLPAFGVADFDLTSQRSLPSDPPKLPSWWNLFGRAERKKILASEKFLPKVERVVISRYAKADDFYHFLRDLHIANIDPRSFGSRSENRR